MTVIRTPFSEAAVAAINNWQNADRPVTNPFGLKAMPPFQCPGDIAECGGERQLLTATVDGLTCPCGRFLQTWTHDFVAGMTVEPEPPMRGQ